MERANEHLDIEDLKRVVSSLGLELVKNVLIEGKSGIAHFFELAVASDRIVAIIHMLKRPTASEVFKALVYKMDTEIPQLLLCSDLGDDATEIVPRMGVEVIRRDDQEAFKVSISKYTKS